VVSLWLPPEPEPELSGALVAGAAVALLPLGAAVLLLPLGGFSVFPQPANRESTNSTARSRAMVFFIAVSPFLKKS
jgi:hypothetical protein